MSTERDKGIQAIIDLQTVMGIEETHEQASEGWDGMTESEQELTMNAHNVICGLENIHRSTK